MFGARGVSGECHAPAAGAVEGRPDAVDALRDAKDAAAVGGQGGRLRRHHGLSAVAPSTTEAASATRQNRASSSTKNRGTSRRRCSCKK